MIVICIQNPFIASFNDKIIMSHCLRAISTFLFALTMIWDFVKIMETKGYLWKQSSTIVFCAVFLPLLCLMTIATYIYILTFCSCKSGQNAWWKKQIWTNVQTWSSAKAADSPTTSVSITGHSWLNRRWKLKLRNSSGRSTVTIIPHWTLSTLHQHAHQTRNSDTTGNWPSHRWVNDSPNSTFSLFAGFVTYIVAWFISESASRTNHHESQSDTQRDGTWQQRSCLLFHNQHDHTEYNYRLQIMDG
jgi:hypothetical protein